ncbi:uncharacterized protein LOC123520090 [Portunus trituberculatus]|uniref:uncharacterized protein LOC123520090 n=1 Tax=Portunus trituberculatus TaxID=210409 RepID=UPI001E1D0775|nr:uncharacterized protein LOC123520090 [Portunus trituberculatus]XP_045137915.1 uncharacterized protein LOC123520090 [Portunus trituberculatus]XP_045137916.1 uncharacterized protein LOC123520090 [Portunus trituberculatus]XP_045137917.1 uncharacterized protein LOC123520090 [Portunus trituberculatus]
MSREPCFFRSLHVSWSLHVSGNSKSRGPSDHLTESTSSLANTQTAENSLDSKDWPFLCCPGFTLSLLPGAVNESASSVGEISVPRSGDKLLVRAGVCKVSLLLLYCVYLCVFASLVNFEPFKAVYYCPHWVKCSSSWAQFRGGRPVMAFRTSPPQQID